MSRDDHPISKQKFMDELRRYQLGSVTRRHFLGLTGLGLARRYLHVTAGVSHPLAEAIRPFVGGVGP